MKMPVGPFKEGSFTSLLHSPRVAALLGISLAVAFGTCFFTGLLSHAIQRPPTWFEWPSRPAGLYRITQGLHVATGIASIPLLFAKLWTVYPKLYTWPPITSALHAIERLALVPLVAGSVFMLFTGTANIINWYPWGFFFPAGHYWGAWITIGALIIHIGAKWTLAGNSLRHPPPEPHEQSVARRRFLGTSATTAGLLTLVTVGQTLRPLRKLAVLAPRDPDAGPQGLPVNKSAKSAKVLDLATDPSWTLKITGAVKYRLEFSLDELSRMPQHSAGLPISCVEGWSADARWTGVRVRDILASAGAKRNAQVRVESLQPRGLYRTSMLSPSHQNDPDTLLALKVNGEPLHLEHGFPCRLIGPNRPGVLQTKWVSELIVL